MPVRRYYNQGRGGAPNHAYTPHRADGAALAGAGFVDEGVAFCVPTSHREAYALVAALAGTAWEMVDLPSGKQRASPTRLHFGDGVSSHAGALFEAIGLHEVAFAAHPLVDKATTSVTGWDPVSHAYTAVATGGPKVDAPAVIHQLDHADRPVMAGCRHELVVREAAFQTVLWTGCQAVSWMRR